MLSKGQEGHVRAEKDILAAAATAADSTSRWIVKLHYSFQVSLFAERCGEAFLIWTKTLISRMSIVYTWSVLKSPCT